jgi:hypothetical protein
MVRTNTQSSGNRQISLSSKAQRPTRRVALYLSEFAAEELRRLLQSVNAMGCGNQAFEEILRQLNK